MAKMRPLKPTTMTHTRPTAHLPLPKHKVRKALLTARLVRALRRTRRPTRPTSRTLTTAPDDARPVRPALRHPSSPATARHARMKALLEGAPMKRRPVRRGKRVPTTSLHPKHARTKTQPMADEARLARPPGRAREALRQKPTAITTRTPLPSPASQERPITRPIRGPATVPIPITGERVPIMARTIGALVVEG